MTSPIWPPCLPSFHKLACKSRILLSLNVDAEMSKKGYSSIEFLMAIILFIIGVIAIAAFKGCSSKEKVNQADQQASPPAVVNDYCDSSTSPPSKAFTLAKFAVKENLKNPADAEFAGIGDANIVRHFDKRWPKCGFVVSSYVDATNSFGAKIRNRWAVYIEWRGGDDYSVDKVKFLK